MVVSDKQRSSAYGHYVLAVQDVGGTVVVVAGESNFPPPPPYYFYYFTAAAVLGLLYGQVSGLQKRNASLSQVTLALGKGKYSSDTLALSLTIVAVEVQRVGPIAIALEVM